MRRVAGEITLDIGPGAQIRIAAGTCQGMAVSVKVGAGEGVRVGSGVFVSVGCGVRATAVSVPDLFAASAVSAMTVGRYSGGYGVGAEEVAGDAKGEQPARNPRREARRIRFRFMQSDSSTSPASLKMTCWTCYTYRSVRPNFRIYKSPHTFL